MKRFIPVAVVALFGVPLLLGANPPKKGWGLREHMESKLNPALTEASFELFHGRADETRLREVASKLRDESYAFVKTMPKDTEPEMRATAVQLLAATEGLSLAVTNGASRTELQHWFEHVGAACVTCHTQFKEPQ